MSATLTARSAANQSQKGCPARDLTVHCPSLLHPLPGQPTPAKASTSTGLAAERPDVVLMALNPSGADNPGPAQSAPAAPTNYYFVVITTDEETARELETLSSGESGCHLSRIARTQLIEAVQEARAAGPLTSQRLAGKLVKFFKPATKPVPEEDALSSRERQVMEFLAQGYPYKCIARDLGVSLHTVRNYLRRTYRKLGAHSRTHAVARFLSPASRAVEA